MSPSTSLAVAKNHGTLWHGAVGPPWLYLLLHPLGETMSEPSHLESIAGGAVYLGADDLEICARRRKHEACSRHGREVLLDLGKGKERESGGDQIELGAGA